MFLKGVFTFLSKDKFAFFMINSLKYNFPWHKCPPMMKSIFYRYIVCTELIFSQNIQLMALNAFVTQKQRRIGKCLDYLHYKDDREIWDKIGRKSDCSCTTWDRGWTVLRVYNVIMPARLCEFSFICWWRIRWYAVCDCVIE